MADKQSDQMAARYLGLNADDLDSKQRNSALQRDKQPKQRTFKYRKYGLEPNQQQQLFDKQQGRCAICGANLTRWPNIDHDHTTGQARGFLCPSCNLRLAGIENADFKAKAKTYLANPPAARFYA